MGDETRSFETNVNLHEIIIPNLSKLIIQFRWLIESKQNICWMIGLKCAHAVKNIFLLNHAGINLDHLNRWTIIVRNFFQHQMSLFGFSLRSGLWGKIVYVFDQSKCSEELEWNRINNDQFYLICCEHFSCMVLLCLCNNIVYLFEFLAVEKSEPILYVNKQTANGNEWISKIAFTYCSRWPTLPAYLIPPHTHTHTDHIQLNSMCFFPSFCHACIGCLLLNEAQNKSNEKTSKYFDKLAIHFIRVSKRIQTSSYKHTHARDEQMYRTQRWRERLSEIGNTLKKVRFDVLSFQHFNLVSKLQRIRVRLADFIF